MSNYSNFAAKALEALYIETDGDLSSRVPLLPMLEKFGIQIEKSHWINTLQNEWHQDEIAQFINAGTAEGQRDQIVAIQWRGVKQAEAHLSETMNSSEVSTELTPVAVQVDAPGPNDILLHPVGVLSAGTTPSMVQLRDFPEAEIVPASDRVVRFDHNNPSFAEISDGISEVREAVRTANGLDSEPEDRERLLAALDAAQSYWQAVQIKVINLKVGILLALEDAKKFLGSTVKAVAAALLVDTFKAFVKSHTGVDLENL